MSYIERWNLGPISASFGRQLLVLLLAGLLVDSANAAPTDISTTVLRNHHIGVRTVSEPLSPAALHTIAGAPTYASGERPTIESIRFGAATQASVSPDVKTTKPFRIHGLDKPSCAGLVWRGQGGWSTK
jgi:hypothetical protein